MAGSSRSTLKGRLEKAFVRVRDRTKCVFRNSGTGSEEKGREHACERRGEKRWLPCTSQTLEFYSRHPARTRLQLHTEDTAGSGDSIVPSRGKGQAADCPAMRAPQEAALDDPEPDQEAEFSGPAR